MATKLWAILLVLFTALLTSSAQILWKIGSKSLTFDILGVLGNYYIIGGIFIYIVCGILLILTFRGGEVSVIYPIFATSYIWVSLLSVKFLNEVMNKFKWIGIAAIISGIFLIGYGSKEHLPGAIQ